MSDNEHDGKDGPNTQFLDFELEKVMFDEAESIVRDAFRMLLEKAAKKRIKELWGDRIKALAKLAVDEALADAEASFAVQEIVETRNDAKQSLEDRIRGIIHDRDDDDSDDDDDDGDDGDSGDGGDDKSDADGSDAD